MKQTYIKTDSKYELIYKNKENILYLIDRDEKVIGSYDIDDPQKALDHTKTLIKNLSDLQISFNDILVFIEDTENLYNGNEIPFNADVADLNVDGSKGSFDYSIGKDILIKLKNTNIDDEDEITLVVGSESNELNIGDWTGTLTLNTDGKVTSNTTNGSSNDLVVYEILQIFQIPIDLSLYLKKDDFNKIIGSYANDDPNGELDNNLTLIRNIVIIAENIKALAKRIDANVVTINANKQSIGTNGKQITTNTTDIKNLKKVVKDSIFTDIDLANIDTYDFSEIRLIEITGDAFGETLNIVLLYVGEKHYSITQTGGNGVFWITYSANEKKFSYANSSNKVDVDITSIKGAK